MRRPSSLCCRQPLKMSYHCITCNWTGRIIKTSIQMRSLLKSRFKPAERVLFLVAVSDYSHLFSITTGLHA